MAGLMVANAPPELLGERGTSAAALVAVPVHPRRARRRAFNQASVLARAVAARSGQRGARMPVEDCLRRHGADRRQLGRGRAARLEWAGGSIRVRRRPPPSALLVDDVVTTGATLAACATALREAGCAHVAAIAFARTLGR
jgi:predicted amidophosphoribosyltransferase